MSFILPLKSVKPFEERTIQAFQTAGQARRGSLTQDIEHLWTLIFDEEDGFIGSNASEEDNNSIDM